MAGIFEVGEHTYGGSYIERRGTMNNVYVGKYCSIAQGVVVDGGFSHNTEYVSTYPFQAFHGKGGYINYVKGDVVIKDDVWIAESVMIMSGVTIGEGAVIGARAIITKDVKPYSVVVGNNKVIRMRFTDEQINELLKIKWWDWTHDKVLGAADLLSSLNIQEFIDKYKV
jgi:acetyltransferase-like isoleucine patch superfamily enzyme